MKNLVIVLGIFLTALACTTQKPAVASSSDASKKNDTIRIANDSLEYEVIIIDSGFESWLASRAYPRNYYSQSYLENKNRFYVQEWNIRARSPLQYGDLYEMEIDYNPTINYGYEVNYLIYNYMVYFQNKYHQSLFGRVPDR